MGKLSVLGAQRIKALEGMLDDQLKEKIYELGKVKSPFAEATKALIKELGAEEEYNEMLKLAEQFNEVAERFKDKTGTHNKISVSTTNYSNYNDYCNFDNRRKELMEGEFKAEENKLREEYKRKKQMLWLCETLEEAKEIVGIE